MTAANLPSTTPFSPATDIPAIVPPEDSSASRAVVKSTKVVHVINGEHFSGAERVQDLLGKCLPSLGYEVTFACVKPGKFAEARSASKSRIVNLPMRFRFDLLQAFRLARLVKQENFELIHAHTPRSAMIAASGACLTGVPFVYHVHSPTARDSTRKWQNWVNQRIENASIGQASKLICVSHSLAEHMQAQGVHPDRLSVVHNGVPRLTNVVPRITPSGSWVLGTVALFRPRKGLEVLLEALAELRRRGHHVVLRAVGPFESPEYERSIHALAGHLGIGEAIQWVGFTRDVNTQLSQMDVFVLPSLFGEGLPMVVLEAMAAGTPVVATAVEGVTEALIDGQCGMVAEAGNAQHLAERLSAVISGEVSWQSLRQSALQRHAEMFSDAAMARGVAAAYDQILQKSPTAAGV